MISLLNHAATTAIAQRSFLRRLSAVELCTPTERRICSRRQRRGASALGYIHITVIGRVPLHAIRVLRYFYLYVCSRDKNSIKIVYVHRLCSPHPNIYTHAVPPCATLHSLPYLIPLSALHNFVLPHPKKGDHAAHLTPSVFTPLYPFSQSQTSISAPFLCYPTKFSLPPEIPLKNRHPFWGIASNFVQKHLVYPPTLNLWN